ncbi:hypothetical protein [Ahniella affigens]|uniref:hypothetical protein n=1 Tax=Ahniella affigens TaxID=2021234 RepID=UPI003CCCD200
MAEVRDAARQRLGLLGMSEAQIRAVEHAKLAQTRISVVARDGHRARGQIGSRSQLGTR